VAVVACQNFSNVLKVLQAAKRELPDVMQAIEYMDLASMDIVRKMNASTVYPFDQNYKHYVLIEVAQTVDPFASSDSSGSEGYTEMESDRLFNFLETIENLILVSNWRSHLQLIGKFRTAWSHTMKSSCTSFGTSEKASQTRLFSTDT